MGGLFSSPKIIQPPAPEPPPPMPDPMDNNVREAQRKAAEAILQRSGRASTILSAGNDKRNERLGGGGPT